jgi:hypothetical protein
MGFAFDRSGTREILLHRHIFDGRGDARSAPEVHDHDRMHSSGFDSKLLSLGGTIRIRKKNSAGVRMLTRVCAGPR